MSKVETRVPCSQAFCQGELEVIGNTVKCTGCTFVGADDEKKIATAQQSRPTAARPLADAGLGELGVDDPKPFGFIGPLNNTW
jgi:hypothetical protein